jgi:hypothetical protein
MKDKRTEVFPLDRDEASDMDLELTIKVGQVDGYVAMDYEFVKDGEEIPLWVKKTAEAMVLAMTAFTACPDCFTKLNALVLDGHQDGEGHEDMDPYNTAGDKPRTIH